MKKVGYFFYTFVPLLAVEAIQTIALFFMMGMGVFGQGFVGKLAFPSANVSDRLEKTFTSVNFNMMIMVIYALITIAIFGMWYYARYEGNFLPSPKKTFNPMMIVAIVILVPGTQFAANFIANLTGYIRPDWLQQYNKLFETSGITDTTFVTVLYSVILAPICEELIFRGVTMRCARKALPFALANLMQAATFRTVPSQLDSGHICLCTWHSARICVRTRWLYLLLYGASSAFQPLGHTFRIFP